MNNSSDLTGSFAVWPIPYWLLVVLLVLGPVEVGAQRLVQRIKRGRQAPSAPALPECWFTAPSTLWA